MNAITRHTIGLLASALWVFTPGALAQSTAFTYQGKLNDGSEPASGLHDFRFRLFDAAVAGAQVGTTQCVDNLLVGQGLFTATLDFGAQFTTPAQRFIEISVRADTGLTCADASGFQTLSPRQLITAAPLATHAKSAFSLDAADGSPANVVFVDNSGNVGVGTTAPIAKLHVNNGDILAGAPGEEWLFHTRSSFGGDFLHITDNEGGVFQFQRGITLDEFGTVVLRNPNFNVLATGGVENLRIIRGIVKADGTIQNGQGFTAVRLSAGIYVIHYTQAFLGAPAVVVTPDAGGFTTGVTAQTAQNSSIEVIVQIKRIDDLTSIDRPFSFISMGVR